MSTYVDLILNGVEFKIIACILLEKTITLLIEIYYCFMCERYGTLYRFNRDHKCNSEAKTKNRTLSSFFTEFELKCSDKFIMLLPK